MKVPRFFYYFDFIDSPTGGTGGSDSSWQLSTTFTDTALQPNHQYEYKVKAKDSASTPNENTPSSPTAYIYTLANAPIAAPFSNITRKSIQANWTANGNRSGTEYYCENATKGTSSGWTTNIYWNETGLICGTSYSYRVKARNGDGIETEWVNLGDQKTDDCDVTPPIIGQITVGPPNKVTSTYVDSTFDLSATLTDNESDVSNCQYCVATDGTCDTEWADGTLSGSKPTWTCTMTMTGITGFDNGTNLKLNIRGSSEGGTGTGSPISRIVDSSAPTTTASATACGSPSPYTFNTWTKCSPVSVTLSANDGTGSGVASGYPKYCVNTDTCTPGTPYTAPADITCPTDSTCPNQYIRYYSVDNVSKTESEKSSNVKIDRQRPTDCSINAEPGDKKVTLNWCSASDGVGSGIKNYKLVYKIGTPPPDSGCSSGTEIYSGTGTSFTHNGTLTNYAEYCYRAIVSVQ